MPYGQGGTPGNDMTIGNAVGGGTVGSVLFVGAGGVLAQDNANFFWDDVNNQLLLGNGSGANPSYSFGSDVGMGMFTPFASTIRFQNSVGACADIDQAKLLVFGGTVHFGGNDLVLARDAAGVLAQKSGVNAQTLRVYGTTTGPAYLALAHNATDAILSTTVGNVVIDDITETSNKIFPGTDGAARQTTAGIYAGTGVPNNANGNNGDYYFRADGGVGTHLYFKAAGAWAGII